MKGKLKTTSKADYLSYLAGWEVASSNFERWSQDWNTISSEPARRRSKRK